MNADQNKYPVFEANQVLTNAHLNQVFDYLDEQDRLTRANLIGIGIVCGLEVSLDATGPNVLISRGCGVTSEGYLILLSEDQTLVSYKPYDLPDELAYPPFTFSAGVPPESVQYDMWEMFPVGEPDAIPLTNAFLTDKVVVLFLELKKDGLRNCSPNNCDDRGEEVTVTVRKLLFNRADLDKIIAAANGLESGLSSDDLMEAFSAKLNLADLRLPRYDVPNTSPATSDDVLISFFEVFQKVNLATATGNALSAAYTAFKPLLEKDYPSDPFAGFNAAFGFLDTAPVSAAQVKFAQYYYDFFDDLIKAYDEFRWTGVDLLCVCCPPDGLFPRHLMAGEVFPSANAALYRHTFLSSPATCCDCEKETAALRMLFDRLVQMIAKFTNNPPLPGLPSSSNLDLQIRITPSKLADVPVSDKCIPYYYTQDGTPPIYTLWNAEKTRRGRAKQNLSYRADEYATAQFVKNPLRYDLEPYNFLRIEGHLGKSYITVLQTLTALKAQNRLPFEIVALRTGAFDETMTIDLSKEECTFQDLESLYATLREELRCFLCKEMQYFYNLPYEFNSPNKEPYAPKEPLLMECAPGFLVKPQTLGDFFELWYAQFGQNPYADPDALNLVEIINNLQGNNNVFFLFYIIYYMSSLAKVLPEELGDLDCDELENRYLDLEKVSAALENFREEAIGQLEGNFALLNWEEIDDRIEAIMFACRLDPIKAVCKEYEDRIREVKKKQFLSFFLQKNPGIQHKAGVPLGGTFIIVYHDDPDPLQPNFGFFNRFESIGANLRRFNISNAGSNVLSGALTNLQKKGTLLSDPDIQAIFAELTGQIPSFIFTGNKATESEELTKIVADTVAEFTDGTVIADFFLPYICCSDCAPVQFVLPRPPLGFALTLGCTGAIPGAAITASATITPQGGVAPFTYQLDNQPFQPLSGALQLTVGTHTIVLRDSEGSESTPQTIIVPGPLTIGAETYIDNPAAGTWQVQFQITGGTAPYTADSGTVTGDIYLSKDIPSGETFKVEIKDNVGCTVSKEFTHQVAAPCDLPCNGIARRCGYRFWIPIPTPNAPYKSYSVEVPEFSFEFPQGNNVDIAGLVNGIILATADQLNGNFEGVIKDWLEKINGEIAALTGSGDWIRMEYQQLPTDTFGTLFIEHFECLKFRFHIQAFFIKPNINERIESIYDPSGTTILTFNPATGGVITTFLPVFGCTEINKCAPNRPASEKCQGVDMKLEISTKVGQNTVAVDVKTSGSDKPDKYFWEVQDGVPAISDKKKVTFGFTNPEPTVKTIRLTVFTKEGCAVTAETKIDLRNP